MSELEHEHEQVPPDDSVNLLRRFREEGDRSALGQLLERNAPRIARIVRIRLGGTLAARVAVEDVVQQTMLRALTGIERFEPREDAGLVHWLARIAEREIASLARREVAWRGERGGERSLEAHSAGDESGGVQPGFATDSTAIPDRLARRELQEVVDRCLSELPEPLREVVLLRDYARGSWEFIARQLGRPSADAARKLHARARLAVAECVRRRVGDIGARP